MNDKRYLPPAGGFSSAARMCPATVTRGVTAALAASSERARVNVARNVRRAIAAVGRVSAEARAHLVASVRTGHRCRYDPDPTSQIEWHIDA